MDVCTYGCELTQSIAIVSYFSLLPYQAIAAAIRNTQDCSLLDVDPGASTNRTVFSFVGPPVAVVKGALNAAKVAFKLIDMSKHKGTIGF